ncbi:MAG: PRC-barrel domain-containing protein [Burkholderiaceae bacterium]
MLNRISHLTGSSVTAIDHRIGHVKDAYFDSDSWTIRYLVIDTDTWLPGRDVLISPYSVKQPVGVLRDIDVSLTRKQVEESPNIDTHLPVTRRHERELMDHYAYPAYWSGSALWAMQALPHLPQPLPTRIESPEEIALRDKDLKVEDVALRSCAIVTGYEVQAGEDSIGHVRDFLFDDESWSIRYLVVDTRDVWPGGKKLLLAPPWIDRIDWADKTLSVSLSREQIQSGPPYDDGVPVSRDYEKRLHDAYLREGYWNR